MDTVRYLFRHGINAFFDIPTENARKILPRHLEPLERRHGSSVLSVAAFDFWESPIGAYREVVTSLIVAPLVLPGQPLPKAALYPYQVAVTTRQAREHAIERWRLPHWMQDVEIDFAEQAGSISLAVGVDGHEVLSMVVTEHDGRAPVEDLYQVFVQDECMSDVVMTGRMSEHEAEKGSLVLRKHPFHDALWRDDVEGVAFREQWIRDGVETFYPVRPARR
jgi:hypothetical protein